MLMKTRKRMDYFFVPTEAKSEDPKVKPNG